MRKYSIMAILLAAALALSVAGCGTAERKPTTEVQPKTIVVPEVTTVSFDPVKLDDCPKLVKDVARSIKDRETTTWVHSGNNAYILACTGKDNDRLLEVDDIHQRVPEQDTNWLDVKMKYAKKASDQTGDYSNVTVSKADVRDMPEGVGFEVLKEMKTAGTTIPAPTPAAPMRKPQPPVKRPQQTSADTTTQGATITQPSPNQEITSPVKVTGNVKTSGKLRLRLTTSGGEIMKETELSAPAGGGNFEASLDYTPPTLPKQGMVELIAVDTDKVLAKVPVTIK